MAGLKDPPGDPAAPAVDDDVHRRIEAVDDASDATMSDDQAPRQVTRYMPSPSSPSSQSSSSSSGRETLGGNSFAERYHRRQLLGRGGMGEVSLWRDDRLGREVAVKRLLPHALQDETARARFLREARVQGQLEHPAIVPVYDLHDDDDGGLTLTMKRVRGKTLADVIDAARADDVAARAQLSRRLLSAFASVCQAVDFAHARDIVHRDLKPGNIMLGDFGEVYVLDWGLAKIMGEVSDDDVAVGALSPTAMTQASAVMGTLGYMAPEQMDAGRGDVCAATDVYALGCILFEILTGAPLLVAPSPHDVVLRTLEGVNTREAIRQATRQGTVVVPPELEEVLVKATAVSLGDRLPSARALYDVIEGYLQGDRDLARRRALAAEHIADAAVVIDAAAVASDAAAEAAARANAMRELGAAIALDPDNVDAGRAVLKLLASPPRHVPEPVREELAAIDQEQLRAGARVGWPLAMTWVFFAPFVVAMGVLDWRPIIAWSLIIVGIIALTTLNYVTKHTAAWSQATVFSLLGLLCVVSTFVAGPFVMVPTIIATFVAALQAHPSRRMRRIIVVGGCVLLVGLGCAEWMGLLPPAYSFVDGTMVIHPQALALPEVPMRVLLLLSSLGSTLAVALFLSTLRDTLGAAQERVSLLGWHLRQMVPESPAGVAPSSSSLPASVPASVSSSGG